MIGLTKYFGANLGLSVSIGSAGEIIINLEKTGGKVFDVKKSANGFDLLYLEAIGLALKPLEERWQEIDPSFGMSKSEVRDLPAQAPADNIIVAETLKEEKSVEKIRKEIPVAASDIIPPAVESFTSDSEADVMGRASVHKKFQTHKKVFIGILIFGAIGIAFAIFYRDWEREKNKRELEGKLQQFEQDLGDLKTKIDEEAKIPEPTKLEEDLDNATTTRENSDQKSVIILNTPTGWLNVRGGPGTNFEKTGLVYPGENYPLLEESGEWYKIQLDDDQEGWVSKTYTSKQE